MNLISFKHSNQYLPPNFNFNNLKISNDFQKIYNENYVCIFGLSNIPKNIDGFNLYQCKLDKNKNNIINVNILVDVLILQKLLYNSIQIPSRKLLFKLIRRNNKNIFNINNYVRMIFDNIFFLNNNKNEIDLNKLTIIDWCKNIEKKSTNYIDFVNNNIIKIGNIYANTITEEFYTNLFKECYTSIKLKGGIISINDSNILLDTIINHCSGDNFNNKINNYILDDIIKYKYYLKTNSNLILCNNSYDCNKAKNIINKYNKNLKTITIISRCDIESISYKNILDSDFIIVSLKFLNSYRYNNIINNYNTNLPISKLYNIIASEYFINTNILNKKNPFLSHFYWNRIVFYDVHEFININNDSFISNFTKTLNSLYSWVLINNENELKTSFENIFSLITNNYYFFDNDKLNKYIASNLVKCFSIKCKNLDYKNCITWLDFSKLENKLKDKYIKNDNYITNLCNSIQLTESGSIILEKSVNHIKNDLKKKNKIKLEIYSKKNYSDIYNNKNTNKILLKQKNMKFSNNSIDCIDCNNYCQICYNEFNNVNICISECGHTYCFKCAINCILEQSKCAWCRSSLNFDKLYIPNSLSNYCNNSLYGTKIEYIIKYYNENSNKKFIIFSQFDDILKKLKEIFNKFKLKIKYYNDNNYVNNDKYQVFLVSSLLKKYYFIDNIDILIIMDPIYDNKIRSLQENKIIDLYKNDNMIIKKIYMNNSPESSIINNDLKYNKTIELR